MNLAHNRIHDAAALRAHRRAFRIEGDGQMKRIAAALLVLENNAEAVLLALEANRCEAPSKALVDVKAALRLLAEGPKGEFR